MAKKEVNTNKKENNKNKRSFFKDFKAELKKVVWLTPKQLLNNTVAVVTVCLITAAIVFVLDITFESINKHGVDKIKEVVGQSSTQTTDENIEDTNVTDESNTESSETSENNTEESTENDTVEDTNNNAE